jgi:transposase-like protein
MGWQKYWETKAIAEETAGLLPPFEVEKQLNITPSERRKWQDKGYLKAEKFVEIYYKGRYVNVPYFSPEVLNISPETIESWRRQDLEEKKQKLKAAREQAVKKARETVNKRKEILQQLEKEVQKLPQCSSIILKAAFWARLTSRWAKKQQLKGNKRRTTSPETLYGLKNNIIKKIWQLKEQLKNEGTELELKFYMPEEPHHYNFLFCDEHYEEFAWERKEIFNGYYRAIEFFFDHKNEILKCPECRVNIQEHYYSLYSLKIKFFNNTNYHFHIPYPIGKKYLPNYRELDTVEEIENEYGIFRFGSPVTEEEEKLFPLKLVEKESQKIINELETFQMST